MNENKARMQLLEEFETTAAPELLDYKALYELSQITEARLTKERDAAKSDLSRYKRMQKMARTVPFDVRVHAKPERLDYEFCIRIDSLMLHKMHPPGIDREELRYLGEMIAVRSAEELYKINNFRPYGSIHPRDHASAESSA